MSICVNMSGVTHNVEDVNFNPTGGKILPLEVYATTGVHPTSIQWQQIKYRNSAGNIASGYLFSDYGGINGDFLPISYNDFYDAATGSYINMGIWNVRRSTNIYGPDGQTVHAVISAGGQVAGPREVQTGNSHADWLLVKYFKQPNGSWTSMYSKTNGATSNGFAPIGLEYGSTKSTLSIYGGW